MPIQDARTARAVLDVIDAQPERLEMRLYGKHSPCGTVGCLAGHTMLAKGYRLDGGTFYRPDGSRVSIEDDEAMRILGITLEEANQLFFDYENGPDLFRKMTEEAEGRLHA